MSECVWVYVCGVCVGAWMCVCSEVIYYQFLSFLPIEEIQLRINEFYKMYIIFIANLLSEMIDHIFCSCIYDFILIWERNRENRKNINKKTTIKNVKKISKNKIKKKKRITDQEKEKKSK